MQKQTITQGSKDSKGKRYYKDHVDRFDRRSFAADGYDTWSTSLDRRYRRLKANYDLYNSIINLSDFHYITQGLGVDIETLPAKLVNRDISSTKVKAIMGLDLDRPFETKVLAVNREATTEAEQQAFGMVKSYVEDSIMGPIRQQIMESMEGDTSPEAMEGAMQQEEEMTPDKIHKYMSREYQNPAEIMAEQLLEFLMEKESIHHKFRKNLKAAALTAMEVYYIGEKGGHPTVETVNPLYIDFDMSPELDFIEDAEWITVEYRMTPSEVIAKYGDELSTKQIDDIYDYYTYDTGGMGAAVDDWDNGLDNREGIRVSHCVWKGLRKVGFLKFKDSDGSIQETIVPEGYKLNKKLGDIELKWDYIPEVHEGTRIMKDIYVRMRPVPGQHKDINNLYECKLPYYGAVYDHENSEPTSFMDRLKEYQYLYNIVWFRIERAMAADKGKKVFINLNAVPRMESMGLEEFEYFLESADVGYLNPNQEGLKGYNGTIPELVKEVNMTGGENIDKLMNIAEYLDRKAGEAIGVPKELEGSIHQRSAVRNVETTMHTASGILEEFLSKRALVKRNVLQGLLEKAKVVYHNSKLDTLSYVTDDMTRHMLKIDLGLLDSSTLGVFVVDSKNAHEIRDAIVNLAHAAMQTGTISMNSVVKVMRAKGIQEREELLETAEREQRVNQERLMAMEHEQRMALEEAQMQREAMKHEHKMAEIKLQETERRITAIKKQAILALGFDDDKDRNNNQIADVKEFTKALLDEEETEEEMLEGVPPSEGFEQASGFSE